MDIRLHFNSFWDELDKENNVWVWLLRQNHNVILDDINPNLVITMGLTKPFPNVYTIYYSNEPFFPQQCNFADHYLSNFYIENENHTRFPSYYMYIYEFVRSGLIKDLSFFYENDRPIPIKTSFCSFVSRSLTGKRGEFFHKLNQYKHIETNVAPYNNFTIPFDKSSFTSSRPKIEFIQKYKFNISFENNYRGNYSCFPNAKLNNGYLLDMGGLISEKLVEPFISGTIPIYWGSSMVSEEFNTKSFLNYYDFKNENDLIEKIIELDNDDSQYNLFFKESITNSEVIKLEYMVNLMENAIKKMI
jgi:hypothetical protein